MLSKKLTTSLTPVKAKPLHKNCVPGEKTEPEINLQAIYQKELDRILRQRIKQVSAKKIEKLC